MRQEMIDVWMMQYKDKIPPEKALTLRLWVASVPDSASGIMHYIETKNPASVKLISALFGIWGADRFYFGDVGMGILKALLGPVCFLISLLCYLLIPMPAEMLMVTGIACIIFAATMIIWWLVDFDLYKKVQDDNYNIIVEAIKPYIDVHTQGKIITTTTTTSY